MDSRENDAAVVVHLVGTNEADTASFELLAGCDRRAFSQQDSADKDKTDVRPQLIR